MFVRSVLATAAFVAAASAQLTITMPSPNSWWVEGSTNTLAWSCDTSTYTSYTVVVTNTNTSILTAPLSLVATVPNYDCSYTVDQQHSSLAVSDSWTLELTNIQNISDVYASSQFSVKPAGSAYAPSSASGTATGSAASSSSTSSTKTGAASANYIPVGMSMVAALVLGLVVA